MKKIVVVTLLCLSTFIFIHAQAPQGINYQAVVRNAGGNVIASSPVGMQVSIHQSSPTGTVVYSETFNTTTSAIGLVNLVIGQGTVVTGTFAGIDWSSGPYFCELGLDPSGGSSYTTMGTQQLMSVPYALFAENSNNPGPAGPTGANGNDGVGVDTAYVSNDSLFIMVTSGQTINAGYVTGNIGPIGPTGATGANGTNGSTWLTGTIAPTAGLGVNNDLYLNISNGDYYLKTSGTWNLQGNLTGPTGPTGATGANGTNGTNGSTWLTGTIAPTAGLGVNNDLYLNTSNGDYYLKTSGTWNLQGNLTGPTGPTGLLPNGTAAGNTPYWNGTTWVTNSNNLFNNGGNIGIGTVSPQQILHLNKTSASNTYLQITNSITGSGSTDGLMLGIGNTGDAMINYNETGDFKININGSSALWINSAGRIGVGGAPEATYGFTAYNLSQNPGIAIDNSVYIGDILGNSNGNYFVTDYESASPHFSFIGANVGIGTTIPGEALDITTGNVRIPAANDYKYATAKTHYLSVPAISFSTESSTYAIGVIAGNIYLATGTAATVGYLDAPVYLPDGATVTSVTFSVVDNDGTYNPQQGQLWRMDGSTSTSYGNSVLMASIPIPASSNSTLVQTCTTSTITSAVIDNQNYSYYLRWGTQQNNPNLRLVKVYITYTVTKVD